ncbi:2-C-methyl-D-erythritol 2,4-cyclodiphosphate synthase [Ectothiorhodosinus mongolicus]|uniref:2-C-methyl-D-erythritol 2,4-cyclodiphosphate synthase n=1 Tax=Ectothiorhodosinus mongolicus TaxID=233100 RepID=A0A1R3VMY8_9GAMM|nr:2-C-methyl-D-erythritol 2,4-cyclodiphosphate synthase [Ectothiorhodosinus mongolicus]ULX56331.1 2-C-methyl-D-erythritol 2,4-cyclodiphosphate synthase [Ectothiorhodosinus mongolicus]SIT65844.1 2-C-methyl-D-erythritol 2,4-cyclodiphosphate synthase [Ectothiorhodosinus mongolicus]
MNLRIGHGYDVHAFTEGNHLVLAGVRVPHDRAFKAHSDGDVLAHAVTDAILGAAALGDIGQHFPDTDPAYEGVDSRILLCQVVALIKSQGFEIGNIDATIIAQAPKMGPHIPQMRAHLAKDCEIPVERVNVKATTTERLGFAGREEGIAAHAVVLITKKGTDLFF